MGKILICHLVIMLLALNVNRPVEIKLEDGTHNVSLARYRKERVRNISNQSEDKVEWKQGESQFSYEQKLELSDERQETNNNENEVKSQKLGYEEGSQVWNRNQKRIRSQKKLIKEEIKKQRRIQRQKKAV